MLSCGGFSGELEKGLGIKLSLYQLSISWMTGSSSVGCLTWFP